MVSLEEYVTTLDNFGDSILSWADPKQVFIGYTYVSRCCCLSRLEKVTRWCSNLVLIIDILSFLDTGLAFDKILYCLFHCTSLLSLCSVGFFDHEFGCSCH